MTGAINQNRTEHDPLWYGPWYPGTGNVAVNSMGRCLASHS